jgi:hypothetical protein
MFTTKKIFFLVKANILTLICASAVVAVRKAKRKAHSSADIKFDICLCCCRYTRASYCLMAVHGLDCEIFDEAELKTCSAH